MKPLPRHALAAAGTALTLAAALTLPAWQQAAAPLPKAPPSWPLLGGAAHRNPVNTTEKNIADDWTTLPGAEKNVLWSVLLGSKAYGGPTIAGGRIFIGTNNVFPRDPKVRGDRGVVMCFRERDGAFLWQIVHDKLAAGRVNDWPEEGVASSPAVEGDRLWYVSNRCELVCATTEGKVVWTLDMIRDLGVFPHNLAACSPLVVGDTVFVVTGNGVDAGHIHIPAPNAPSFLAVNKRTGKVLWKDNSPGRNIMHAQWANPVYAEAGGRAQIIFPGGDGWIYSFNPRNGELLWKFDCNPKGAKYRLGAAGTRNDFVNTPVVWENKLYIGVGQDPEHKKGVGHLWCIDITRKPTNKDRDVSPWSDPKDETPSKFDPKDPRNKDSALVWHHGGVTPDDHDREYYFGRTLSCCAVHDGLCYAADLDGFVYCFDARTGEKYWDHEMMSDPARATSAPAETWSSPYWVDGKVYIGNEKGQVVIFRHGKKKEVVRTVQMRGKVRRPPVALNGVLYVVTENPTKLWAIRK